MEAGEHLDEPFQHLDDVWSLSTRSMAWERMDNQLPEGAQRIHPARRGHSAAPHLATGRIVCFGGTSDGERTLNDTWILHTRPEVSWERPECAGELPLPRRGHRATVVANGSTYLVVGGYAESSDDTIDEFERQQLGVIAGEPQRSDGGLVGMHALRLASFTWEAVRVCGAVPHGLALFGMAHPKGSDRIFCFGGHEYARFRGPRRHRRCCNTLWSCDISELRVHSDPAAATATSTPVALWEHVDYVYEPQEAVDEAASRAASANIAAAPPRLSPLGQGVDEEFVGDGRPTARFCLELVPVPSLPGVVEDGDEESAGGGGGGATEGGHRLPSPLRFLVFGGTDRDEQTINDLHLLTLDWTASARGGGGPSPTGGGVPSSPPSTALSSGGAGQMPPPGRGLSSDSASAGDGHPRLIYTSTKIVAPGSRGGSERGGMGGGMGGVEWPSPRNGMSLTPVDGCSSRFVLFGGGILRVAYYRDAFAFELDRPPPSLPPPTPLSAAVLLPHLGSLVGSERFSDVDIALDDGGPPVPAHRLLLCSGAARYFDLALMGSGAAGAFREAAAVQSGGRVVLGLPISIPRQTLLVVLRWLYTGRPPSFGAGTPAAADDGMRDLADAADAALAEAAAAAADLAAADGGASAGGGGGGASAGAGGGGGGAGGGPDLVELLVAADALGVDSLRALCESELAGSVDEAQALELLALAEHWNCERLRTFCLLSLRRRFGALQRTPHPSDAPGATGEPQSGGAATAAAGTHAAAFMAASWRARREAADAAQVARLGGFDALSDGAKADLEWHLGLPDGYLRRSEGEVCDAEAEAATIPEASPPPATAPTAAHGVAHAVLAKAQGAAAPSSGGGNVPVVGMALELLGLRSRSDLNGLGAILTRLPPKLEELSTARWEVRVCRTGEQIRVLPENVRRFGWSSMAEESWQWTWRGRLMVREEAGPGRGEAK